MQDDFAAWQAWMKDGVDEDTKSTWYTWHREQLARRTSSDHARANTLLCAAAGIIIKLPSLAIAVFTFQFGIRPERNCTTIISCNQCAPPSPW